MKTTEDIFNASQFVILKCIRNITEIHKNLQDLDVYLARHNVSNVEDGLSTLKKLIRTFEELEYGHQNVEDIIDDDTEKSTSTLDEENAGEIGHDEEWSSSSSSSYEYEDEEQKKED